jgi:hypothetical protein
MMQGFVMKRLPKAALFLAAAAWVVLSSQAQTVYTTPPVIVFDSFGPGWRYNQQIVSAISGADTSYGYISHTEYFTPSTSGNFSNAVLATYHVSGSLLSNFFITSDDFGGPGTILESFLNVPNNANGLLTLNSVAHPFLEAGRSYYLADEPADPTSLNGWYWASQPSDNCVFRISAIPVPEPAVASLAIAGLCLAARRWPARSSAK